MCTKYFTLLIAVLMGLSSCKIIAPNYSSVEKISKLQREMGIDQAVQTLGCNPFDYYYSSEERTKTLHFHYRFRERKVSPDKTQLRIGLTGGKERFPKKSEFYVTFKNDKLYQITSKDGFLESRNLLIYENTIREMKRNETDFIDPGEESRSFKKEDYLNHSGSNLQQSPGIGKLQDGGSSASLQSLEKSESLVSSFESRAKSGEFGLMLGTCNYTGTYTNGLADRSHYNFSGGIFGQYNVHKWFSIRAMVWLGKISGDDLSSSSISNRGRLGNFKNFIVEGSLTFNWNLLPYELNSGKKFVPSIFAGIGIFRNNPLTRIFMTLDREGEPIYLRWNSETNSVAVDWRNNSDGYNESKDLWIPLQPIGTEGQTVEDKIDPEANSASEDADFFKNRTAPDKYKKIQISIPVGFEFSWIINSKWNIGATIGWRFTTTRYLDDVGGYFFDRINNHQAIVDANPEIQGKVGRDNITIPTTITFTDDGNRTATYYTAALLSNPSLVITNDVSNFTDPNTVNYAYSIEQPYDNHSATRRTEKGIDNHDSYFFAGVKVSYILRKKDEKKEKPYEL